MSTFLPAAGRLALAERCSHPWSLHRPQWPRRKVAGESAGFGVALSQVAECAAAYNAAPIDDIAEACKLKPADHQRLRLVGRRVVELVGEESASWQWRWAECSIAYHVESGGARLQKKAHGRDYSDGRDGEVECTPDLIGVDGEGVLVVRDYKSGFKQLQTRTLGEHRQLEVYGVAAAHHFGARRVRLELALCDEDGVRLLPRTLEAFDLAAIRGWARNLIAGVGAHVPPRPGAHCRDMYCPVLINCPATRAAERDIEAAVALSWPLDAPLESNEQAAERHAKLKLIREAYRQRMAALGEELEEWVREHGPVDLPDGRVLSLVEQPGREWIDLGASEALTAVRHHLGELVDEAVTMSTTKGELEAACRKLADGEGRGAIKGRVTALYDDLRRVGGIRRAPPSVRVDEVNKEAAE